MITRAKLSAVRANSFVVLEQFIVFFLVIRNSSNKRRIGGAALIRGRRLFTFLSQMRRLIEGGAYCSKYGICRPSEEDTPPNLVPFCEELEVELSFQIHSIFLRSRKH